MADILKRLVGPVALTNAAVTVYTVPGLTSTVLRSLRVVNESAASATFTLSIGADGAGKRVWYTVPVAVADGYDWTGNIVLATGEIVQAYASANTALTLLVSGVESS